jgi:hypothetical protein
MKIHARFRIRTIWVRGLIVIMMEVMKISVAASNT